VKKVNRMNDLISRAEAIDTLENTKTAISENGEWYIAKQNAIMRIDALPSAQPEIIQCKDCKHFIREDIEEYAPYGFYNTYFHAFCDKHWDKEQGEYIDVNLDDYCSFAERREVTT